MGADCSSPAYAVESCIRGAYAVHTRHAGLLQQAQNQHPCPGSTWWHTPVSLPLVPQALTQHGSGQCRQHRAALAIQCAYRRHRAQADYQHSVRSVILAQNAWRSRVARRKLRCASVSFLERPPWQFVTFSS